MKRIINIGIGIILLWVVLSNCVDKFNAHLPVDDMGLLIVEGNIISDSTVVFSLSRSFSLDRESFPQDYNQIDAEVSVVGSDGSCFNGTYLGKGKYQVAIGKLSKDAGYNLKIVYEGDTYTSEPQQPLETEKIESVTYEQPEEYGDIYIRVSTQSKEASYYLWSYEEDWEVKSVYKALYFYDPTTDEVTVHDTAPYEFGWCHNESSEILLGTTENNMGNCFKDKRLYSIDHTDNRVSRYYSALIKQRKIAVGEYEYYQNKVKLNEEMGGLFTPQPSELPTNIICSNPEKKIIGYVGVNMNVTEYRIFISTTDIQYENAYDCEPLSIPFASEYSYFELYSMGYCIAYIEPKTNIFRWAARACTDIRYLVGATLVKPLFWPKEIN